MDEDDKEEYVCTLITQPPRSKYNQYDDEKCVPATVLERVFCEDDDVDYSTESDKFPYLSHPNLTVSLLKIQSHQNVLSFPVLFIVRNRKLKQKKVITKRFHS